ncbi:MAG: glycosyltransferase family 8 protein [Gammaproteobacteria bacterium]|nr:glycosyltransferase family 8 protein [Gammaproteobacteria bacterium]
MERIPGIMWYRIFLPELLPEQSRVLYLDADTLVVDSLLPLWDSDLGDCVIGAVTNVLEPQHRQRPAQLGLSDSSGYFNSGVLLMNLDLMRKEDSTRQIVEHAARHGHHLLWPDQDALNVVFAGKRHPLHPRWNCMNSLFHFPYSRDVYGEVQLREAVAAPAILHFEGPGHAKPWHFENRHPFRRQYYRHMRGTGWPMPRPVGLSAIAVLRRLVPAPVRGLLRQMRHLFQTVTSGGGHKSMDAAKTPVLPERLTEDPRQNRENHR